jgi:hypothetical protein
MQEAIAFEEIKHKDKREGRGLRRLRVSEQKEEEKERGRGEDSGEKREEERRVSERKREEERMSKRMKRSVICINSSKVRNATYPLNQISLTLLV